MQSGATHTVDRGRSIVPNNKPQTAPVTIYMTCKGTPPISFDRAYYVSHHLPLVMKALGAIRPREPHRLFTTADHTSTIAICERQFAGEPAMTATFSSSESATVMANVARFIDVQPTRVRAMLLK